MREALEETRFRGRECESMFGHFDEPEFFERGENALRGVTSRSKYLRFAVGVFRLFGNFFSVVVEGVGDVSVGVEHV